MQAGSISDIPGGYRFVYDLQQVIVDVRRISDERRDNTTTAEFLISSTSEPILLADDGHLVRSRINLCTTVGKANLAKALRSRDERVEWGPIVEEFCELTLKMHRQGEPARNMAEAGQRQGTRYRLKPLIVDNAPNVLFGLGGTGKSLLALWAGVLVQTGGASCGMDGTEGNVMYLDYESSFDVMAERLRAICTSLHIPTVPMLYRFCYHPIANDLDALGQMVYDNHIKLLIIDSAAYAVGGDLNDAEPVLRMTNALRELKVASLIVAHVAKNQQPGQRATPFGSVFLENAGRQLWQIKGSDDEANDVRRVGLYHTKVNDGRKHAPIGFEFEYGRANDELTGFSVRRIDPSTDTNLRKDLTLRQQIVGVLRTARAGTMDLDTISSELDMTEAKERAVVAATLRRNRGHYFQQVGSNWGLAERQDAE